MAKYGKRNHVKLDLLSYNVCLLGESGVGKTTIMKQVCEKLAGENGYFFAEFGREHGADAIEGIVYEDFPTWESFVDFVDDVVKNKSSDYKELRVVIGDTYDQMIDLAGKEALDTWNLENPDKRAKSLNGSWGGFGAGDKKAIEIMFTQIDRLESVGVKFWEIGHVKNKSMTDVASGDTYQILTSDQQQNYFNALKKNLHFLGLAYIDREIVKEKTGRKNIVTKQEEVKSVVKEETRKIKFRDDNYCVDSKSRFAKIIPEIPLDANAFIKAMTDAILEEQKKSGKSLEETMAEQEAEKAVKEAEIMAKEVAEKELKPLIEKILAYVKENMQNFDAIEPVLTLCKELGYENPTLITDIGDAKKVAELIK